jgi:hypothetical protein
MRTALEEITCSAENSSRTSRRDAHVAHATINKLIAALAADNPRALVRIDSHRGGGWDAAKYSGICSSGIGKYFGGSPDAKNGTTRLMARERNVAFDSSVLSWIQLRYHLNGIAKEVLTHL